MGNIFNRLYVVILILFVFIQSSIALAHFEFSPITISLSTTGKGNHAIAQVVNRESFPVPIVIRVTERKLLENGEEDRPDTTEVAVFPSQFLLEAKESKSVKVSWQGGESVPNEKAYRIIVEEVPVEFTAKTANRGAVRILINYVGSVYVNSEKTEGNLILEKVESSTEDNKSLSMLFTNKGNGHVILKSPSIELTAKASAGLPEKKYLFDKTTLTQAEGKNILALSKLRVKIPKPNDLVGYSDFEWKFTYEK